MITKSCISKTTTLPLPQSPVKELKVIHRVDWDTSETDLGDYDHFMQKEIFEQPTSWKNGMRGRFSDDDSTAVFGG